MTVVPELPLLVLVAGPPGAGKSTLARRLGDELFLPVLVRDEVKESLTRVAGMPEDRKASQALGGRAFDAFYEIVACHLGLGVGLVAEAAFQAPLAQQRLEPLMAVSRAVLVRCHVDRALAIRRYTDRHHRQGRHPSHTDPAVIAEMQDEGWDAFKYLIPDLDVATLDVDTSDGYLPDVGGIVASIENAAKLRL